MVEQRLSNDAYEIRLFLAELVCNLCRFVHVSRERLSPESVRIRQEVPIGEGEAFVDILVEASGLPGYIVEVEFGQPVERTLAGLELKFMRKLDWFADIQKLVLVVDSRRGAEIELLSEGARKVLPSHWALELWDEARIFGLIREHFGVEVRSLNPEDLQEVRHAIDQANGRYAFGGEYEDSPLDAALLWHFGYWRLPGLLKAAGSKRNVLCPGPHADVAVVFADLCGFSGYVRDTRDERTVRDCLGFFSSKSRHQIIEEGGMLYQFLGDAVIGFFGLPDRSEGYVERSFQCAKSLLHLGRKVSGDWQRRLDRIQAVRGSHIGVALGEIQLFPLRSFSRTYLGAVGDAINMAARLCSEAGPGQIVVSNRVRQSLSDRSRRELSQAEPVQAKNVGLIRAWTFGPAGTASSGPA